ncbi:MAG: LPP20 family lipoprotein [Treponemataceae bacterium]|nr:LPP20 family lipoprotein [Treponemataceae bacterium]
MSKMKSLIKILSVCGLVCFLLVSCAGGSEKAPDWILSPSTVYPDSDYVSAVGMGVSRQDAERDATAALTREIRQRVQAQVTAEESLVHGEMGWSQTNTLASSVDTTSDVEISGITIQEVYSVKHGKEMDYYALALIDRQQTGSYYKSKAQGNIDVINAKIVEAYKNPNTFSSAEILHEAAELAAETDLYLDILSVVNNKMRSIIVPDYKNAQAVAELERQMRAAVNVYIDVDQDVNGRLEAAFKAILKKYNVTTSLDKETASYTLVVNVSFTPFEMPDVANKYARYVLDAAMVESATGNTVFTFNENGREAHLTESEAIQRALRTTEQAINQKFNEQFGAFLNGEY